jgi:hypothetical protein
VAYIIPPCSASRAGYLDKCSTIIRFHLMPRHNYEDMSPLLIKIGAVRVYLVNIDSDFRSWTS